MFVAALKYRSLFTGQSIGHHATDIKINSTKVSPSPIFYKYRKIAKTRPCIYKRLQI